MIHGAKQQGLTVIRVVDAAAIVIVVVLLLLLLLVVVVVTVDPCFGTLAVPCDGHSQVGPYLARVALPARLLPRPTGQDVRAGSGAILPFWLSPARHLLLRLLRLLPHRRGGR